MVKGLLSAVTREISGLHQAAYILAGFTFLAQLLGLVRDRLLAHFFGAGTALDLYYASFRIPDLILVFAASTVSIAILVPYLTERLQTSKEVGKKFIDDIFSVFFSTIVVISAVLFFLIPHLAPVAFPGFEGEERDLLILMTRILLLSPIFLGVSNLFAGIVQVYRRFLVYALSPILYNLGIILGIVFLAPLWGLQGLVWGVVLGAALHMGVLIPSVLEHGFFPSFSRTINFKYVREVITTSLPRAFTLSVSQVVVIVLLGIASTLEEGSIAIFNLSLNLQSVPLGIVGVSYSLAAFPTLSKFFAEKRLEDFRIQVATAARHIIFWSLPAIALFIILRAHIVRVVLGTGEFGWEATRLTAAALGIFSISVLAQGIVLLLVRGYYAMGNTWRPLLYAFISGIATVGLSFLFLHYYEHSSFFAATLEDLWRIRALSGVAVLVLPLSYALGIILNAVLLWGSFERSFRGFTREVSKTFWESLAASIMIGFTSYAALIVLSTLFDTTTTVGLFFQGLGAGVMGMFGGVLILFLLKNRELSEMVLAVRRRFKGVEVVAADTEEL